MEHKIPAARESEIKAVLTNAMERLQEICGDAKGKGCGQLDICIMPDSGYIHATWWIRELGDEPRSLYTLDGAEFKYFDGKDHIKVQQPADDLFSIFQAL